MSRIIDSDYRVLWFCSSGDLPRKCRSLPCHGHPATKDVQLVARVVGWFDDVDWDQVYLAEYQSRLRRAWQLLHRIRLGEKRGDS